MLISTSIVLYAINLFINFELFKFYIWFVHIDNTNNNRFVCGDNTERCRRGPRISDYGSEDVDIFWGYQKRYEIGMFSQPKLIKNVSGLTGIEQF